MPEIKHTTNQFKQITQKRRALETLINIAGCIETQQQSLKELSVLARPSQKYPPQLVKHIQLLTDGLGEQPVSDLLKRLEAVEKVTSKTLKQLLVMAQLDANDIRDEQIANLTAEAYFEAIDQFKSRTQTALALRYILIKRGVNIAPFELAIPQESITGHIGELKKKERGCVKQIRKEIINIVKDSDELLKNPSIPKEMKHEVMTVKLAMRVNLEHLDKGGKVCDIPNVFEALVLETEKDREQKQQPPPQQDLVHKKQPAAIKRKINKQLATKKQQKPSLAKRAKKWLASPWSVGWKDLDDQ
ncbi:MAG: hypothetical protein Q9M92_01165 [Enterobacterales bacterium]|nr:hypothetical protein [Enterobacterales bacterium]